MKVSSIAFKGIETIYAASDDVRFIDSGEENPHIVKSDVAIKFNNMGKKDAQNWNTFLKENNFPALKKKTMYLQIVEDDRDASYASHIYVNGKYLEQSNLRHGEVMEMLRALTQSIISMPENEIERPFSIRMMAKLAKNIGINASTGLEGDKTILEQIFCPLYCKMCLDEIQNALNKALKGLKR